MQVREGEVILYNDRAQEIGIYHYDCTCTKKGAEYLGGITMESPLETPLKVYAKLASDDSLIQITWLKV